MVLGKNITQYDVEYNPDLLDPIPRSKGRKAITNGELPKFYGYDIWNFYEVSWLGRTGKPEVRIATISITSDSEYIVESKSVKLYLNSFNNTVFENEEAVQSAIASDIANATAGDVQLILYPLTKLSNTPLINFGSSCLDDLDVECNIYDLAPELLDGAFDTNNVVSETLHSNLLKSNCLVTNQPDWASVEISYTGPKIDHKKLLQYIISFRNHNEFHEQCIEHIFYDLTRFGTPSELSVYGRYTRRGGIDINPVRCSFPCDLSKINILRHVRQ